MVFLSNLRLFFICYLLCIPSVFGVDSFKLFSIPKEMDFLGAILGHAIGDAMGKPTEFIQLNEQFSMFPNGIRSFNDFHPHDFICDNQGRKVAPYTDDTAMAKLCLMGALRGSNNLNDAMEQTAQLFVEGMNSPDGWAAPWRAPGNMCLKSVKMLSECLKEKKKEEGWWKVGDKSGGGCGSVMRAYVYGLLFYHNLEMAEHWAVESSKLTHGASISLAASAAMAVGTALALQKVRPKIIVDYMIEAASRYDLQTAFMIKKASEIAKRNKKDDLTLRQMFERSRSVFEEFQGWAAHEAIAAATYIFVLSPDNIQHAWYLGVHTPGDSDSIACMAGALVGARVGAGQISQELVKMLEGNDELKSLAKQSFLLACTFPN